MALTNYAFCGALELNCTDQLFFVSGEKAMFRALKVLTFHLAIRADFYDLKIYMRALARDR